MDLSYITVGEVLFLFVMVGIGLAIIFTAGLWRAIELQNTFEDLALKVGVIQGALDVIETVNIAQINFSFDSLRSSVYNTGYNPIDPTTLIEPLTINDWALCTSYPFPNGNSEENFVPPLNTLPPYKNSQVQKDRCDILYAKTAVDLLEN
jgi:hypothetical protein